MRINVMHVMNTINPASTEYEIASRLDPELFSLIIVSYLRTEGVDDSRVISLKARGKLDYRGILKLDALFRKNSIDILHTHHNVSGSIARILAKRHGVPAIVDTEHGSHSRYKLMGNLINDATLFLCDEIVNVSQWVYDSYCKWEKVFLPRSRLRIIHNGVNLERVRKVLENNDQYENNRRKYSISEQDFLFLHAARLTKIKNQPKLIMGFAKAAEKHPEARLIIAGDGELMGDLKKLAWNSGAGDKIIFTGLVGRECVYRLMKESDGFVMNSISEGSSVALLEAMACGLPCILSSIPSFIETTKGTDIGELIAENSVESVADAFIRFMETDRSVLMEKGKRAKKLAEDFYNGDNTVKSYERLYVELFRKKQEMCQNACYEGNMT